MNKKEYDRLDKIGIKLFKEIEITQKMIDKTKQQRLKILLEERKELLRQELQLTIQILHQASPYVC